MIHKEAQKYIVVKKQYFYNRLICKKAAFLHKKAGGRRRLYCFRVLVCDRVIMTV